MHSRLSEQHSAMAVSFKVYTNILLAGFMMQELHTSSSHYYLQFVVVDNNEHEML
jgi:hypothetical protein